MGDTKVGCCSTVQNYLALRKEKARLQKEQKRKFMSKGEIQVEEALNKKHMFVRILFDRNRKFRDPRMNVSPAPHWYRYVLDAFVFLLIFFYAYFIVGFSFYYGPDVANAWLSCFLTSTFIDLMLVSPLTILGKSVFLPRLVAHLVFDNPDLAPLALTPLMSGAVGVMGPTGQMALAMGLVSTAAIGAAGNMANRWRQRAAARAEERKLGLQPGESQVRYTFDKNDVHKGSHSKYSVKAVRSPNIKLKKEQGFRNKQNKKLLSLDFDVNSIGGSRYAVVPLHRHEADQQRRTSIINEMNNNNSNNNSNSNSNSNSNYVVPVPGKMVARTQSFEVVEINSPTQPKNRKIISKSNIDQPDFQKHVVTDDHVLDLIMHLTEGQLQMLGLGEQKAKIEKLKTKSKTENSKFQKLKCIDQSQGRTQVQEEHRYKDHAAAVHAAAARHQEELSMMPETPYHRKRKEKATKEWGEVKSKIKTMYHKKGSSAAKKVTSTWLDQLSEHDHTNSVSSNSNAWATILEEGRVTVEKEMKERSKKFDTAKIKMNYKLEDQQDQQVKLKKAKEKKLVEKQLKALQEMRFQREQIELKKELVRRKAIADQEELDRRGEEARKKTT